MPRLKGDAPPKTLKQRWIKTIKDVERAKYISTIGNKSPMQVCVMRREADRPKSFRPTDEWHLPSKPIEDHLRRSSAWNTHRPTAASAKNKS